MTREEAIEAIKCNWPDSRYTILREALDMAISALRQQECVGDVNKSLTIDELRQMNGEPVWCVSLGAKLSRGDGWYIVGVNNWYMGGYGKTWLAYRQKPEEGDGMKENCAECRHHDVFWGGAGCNLLNNGERCKFEERGGST